MNERERKLAFILAAVMIFGVGGGGFWYGFYGPYSEYQSSIAALQSDVDRQEREIEGLENKSDANLANHPRLKEWRTLSFPPPAKEQTDLAKGHSAALKLDYSNLLTNLLMRNGFKPATTTVKSADSSGQLRAIPLIEGTKKRIYEPYQFDIIGQAKLEDLAGFLQQLHQVPILHQVTYLKVEKLKKDQPKGDMKFTIHVEALMVADAAKKPRLEVDKLLAGLTKPPEKEQILASNKRDYTVLGPANPFFPPDPPTPLVRPRVEPETIKVQGPKEEPEEVLSAVKLTTITGDGKKWEAYLYDQNRGGRETKIRPSAAWCDFSIKDKYENEVMKGKLLHIDPAFILFQYGDEVYMMRCGETLFPCIANPMGNEGLISRGLEKFIPAKPKPSSSTSKGTDKIKTKKPADD